ncbi:hypothetical protein ACFT9I_27795 [Streptomyces sp. NPDC057137]|uniref:hypothetical protein n=1 Tax=Streptomyces sp. NPDC057137 TaxID=3346030 RepID=UPI00363B2E0A
MPTVLLSHQYCERQARTARTPQEEGGAGWAGGGGFDCWVVVGGGWLLGAFFVP